MDIQGICEWPLTYLFRLNLSLKIIITKRNCICFIKINFKKIYLIVWNPFKWMLMVVQRIKRFFFLRGKKKLQKFTSRMF